MEVEEEAAMDEGKVVAVAVVAVEEAEEAAGAVAWLIARGGGNDVRNLFHFWVYVCGSPDVSWRYQSKTLDICIIFIVH